MKTKLGQIIAMLACAFSMTASAQDVRIEAGPTDFLWSFENAVGNISTSLYNNGNPQLMVATAGQGHYTNDPSLAKFDDVALFKVAGTTFNQPSLGKSYSQMTILFWINIQDPNANTFLTRTSDASTGNPGGVVLQYNSGRQFSFAFTTTNGGSGNYFANFVSPSGTYDHVALTFDNGVLSWFHNGVQTATTNIALSVPSASFIPSAIINSVNDTQWKLDTSGRQVYVDDFAIYSQILSTNQLQFIIDNGLQAFNVPEPNSLALVAGASALGWMFRRRR